MGGMGPAPKHQSQRRRQNATVPMTMLPKGGRKGPTPEWPLEDPPTSTAAKIWVDLWTKPQAAAWEKFDLHRSVARYAMVESLFEMGSMKPQVWTECRQLEDRLGLNPLAMLRLRWDVADDELAEVRAERAERARPEAVDPGAVASQ